MQRKTSPLKKLPALKTASTTGLLRNALTHVLLPGPLNKHHLDACLHLLQAKDNGQFVVLLRGAQNHGFKGLYQVHSPDCIGFVYGNGPALLDGKAVRCWYKYDSGRRAFLEVPTKELVGSICAVVMEPTRIA